ncbi:hypothetical protein NQ314_018406 [Rhamnusium bicolor]|uniref:Large ribosomal subunit protein mL40 n=1 Tax=Rhamnusium bicolor TaxID=1586634 RepID=A0AAV8WR98_9CUCU|nr:hypothetical protein NQ314_018406 [Rhamnusium bicolor]
MSFLNIITALNRLSLHTVQQTTLKKVILRNIATTDSTQFRATPVLLAEPLKKKKRLDPAIIRAREERKKKKIEKQIKRLEKNARQLKPIEECEFDFHLIPFKSEGPVETPPIENYDSPDGEYLDVSRKW